MSKHRRKLALAAALVLLFGSAAASAANFVNGRSAIPSFAGASDALGLAMGGAVNASAWMATRSRNAVDEMLAYLRPSSARPPEVESVSADLPRAPSGSRQPMETRNLRHANMVFASEPPDRIHPASFEGGSSSPRQERVPSVDVHLPALPGGGGRPSVDLVPGNPIIAVIPEVTAPIPEPESYAMLLAGLGLIGAIARRRQRSHDA